MVSCRVAKYPLLGSIIIAVIVLGCGKSDRRSGQTETAKAEQTAPFANREEENKYIAELLRFRAEKDSFLRGSTDSPLRKEERRTFQHLKYYDADPQFVVRATLHRSENPPRFTITTTTGTTREAIKYGALRFRLLGKSYQLGVYKFTDKPKESRRDYLFVPFTDSTSGKETYGAGRYIDLEENDSDEYILDFNRAYNPYCAYNEDYSCPIPPRENRLSLTITAGEKIYHD